MDERATSQDETGQPAADDAAMESLTDPESIADRDGLVVREETRDVDAETLELFEDHDGVAAVGITRTDGAVLLWDGPRGWTLPFAFVEPGEDWVAAAETVVAELTGVTFDIAGVEELRRVENALGDGNRVVRTHELVFRAATVTDDVAAELAAFEADDDHPDVDWFEAVPADVDNEGDVRLFLD